MMVLNTNLTPLMSYKDARGNPIFRLERDGTLYIKGLIMHDGTSTTTAGGTSPTPSLVDGGDF